LTGVRTQRLLPAEPGPGRVLVGQHRRGVGRGLEQAGDGRDDPVRVHAILDEAVLHRRIGDAEVMREQLDHLGTLAAMPNITIQVMSFSAADHRGHLGSFKWLGFPQEDDPGAVYLENQLGGWFLEKPEELAVFHTSPTWPHVRSRRRTAPP
jgi:hypothetical protein